MEIHIFLNAYPPPAVYSKTILDLIKCNLLPLQDNLSQQQGHKNSPNTTNTINKQ